MFTSPRNRRSFSPRSGRAVALLACVLCGCAVGPTFHRPAAPPDTHYVNGADPTTTVSAAGTAQQFVPGAAITADWWRLFHSAQLDAMISEAIAKNPGLEAAQASLRASSDELRSGYGIFFPSVDAEAAATRERFTTLNFGEKSPGSIFNLFTLSASVNYALDVFGGNRRMLEALHADVDVAKATEQATYLTLAANIADAVIARAGYRAEIDATRQLITMQAEQVRLAEIQAQAGTVAYSTVLSLRSQLAGYEATIPQLEQKLAQSDDLLAALCGHTPAEWSAPDVALADLALPAQLPVSLPSELMHQRPDILAAEATAHAASANIGVATAAMLPSVTLSGGAAGASNSSSSLFPANGRAWSIGADATVPVFQGGTLWYKRKAAVDTYHQAMAAYRQTVLSAFEQVADTLRALDHDAATLAADDEALADAAQALKLIQANYRAGLVTYLDVLNANAQYQQALINDVQAIAVRYQDTVALFAALGGGWWNKAGVDGHAETAPVAAPAAVVPASP
ncbi:MAG: efflux transporter outer membrane subunit [Steroidobacteraceae bacterium]|jgi:NodT family efflux transporter outer membrane factor (OMF) lipoprotein